MLFSCLSPADFAQHPTFTFEMETSSDWESHNLDVSPAGPSFLHSPTTICKAVVKGFRSNEPVQWEVAFDIGPLFRDRQSKEADEAELWNETFHHLAAKSVIRDFEQLTEREYEIEPGTCKPTAPLCIGRDGGRGEGSATWFQLFEWRRGTGLQLLWIGC